MWYPIKISLSLLVLSTILFSSCTEEQRDRMRVAPSAYGRVDNILVVAESDIWNGAVGDTFRMHFEALYPVTPQPQKVFDIQHVEPKEFNSVRKTHRSIIMLADLSDQGKAILFISSDLKELMGVCDRIMVMSAGRVADTFSRGQWSEEKIMSAAFSEYLSD